MTNDEIKQDVAAYEAHLRGEEVEERCIGSTHWYTLRDTGWGPPNLYNHRLKPKPRTVPWTQEDVPADCWIRRTVSPFDEHKIISRYSKGLGTIAVVFIGYEILAADYEWTADPRDKTSWKPCTKEVSET